MAAGIVLRVPLVPCKNTGAAGKNKPARASLRPGILGMRGPWPVASARVSLRGTPGGSSHNATKTALHGTAPGCVAAAALNGRRVKPGGQGRHVPENSPAV